MKITQSIFATLTLSLAGLFASGISAQGAISGAPSTATVGVEMTYAEVRKIDKEAKKITLKHEEIKNLGMPGMTMVFQVKDAALFDKVTAGDKVKFSAIKDGNAFFVTDIQLAK